MKQQGTAIINMGQHIEECFKEWQNNIAEPSKGTVGPLQDHIQGLLRQVQRGQERINATRVSPPPRDHPKPSLSEAFLAQIAATPYDMPGDLRPKGPRHDNDDGDPQPRHDNDDDDFQSIEIAPTNRELQCKLPPALPINHPTAPHHLPLGTMKRHLDVHFRLYREEFV